LKKIKICHKKAGVVFYAEIGLILVFYYAFNDNIVTKSLYLMGVDGVTLPFNDNSVEF